MRNRLKAAGITDAGTVDLIWINGENFRSMKQGDLAFCGYTGAPFSDLRGAAFKEVVETRGHQCSIYKEAAFASDFLGKMILQAERYGEPPALQL